MAFFPNIPGVPNLLVPLDLSPVSLMIGDTVTNWGGSRLTPQWGLYNAGAPVIVADTVIAFGFRREWNISNYPIERGGFESFNRVDLPFAGRLQFAAGTMAARQALLSSLAAASADGNLTKYDVVTPEVIYPSINIQSYDYDRKAASGVGLLMIEVTLVEIREQNRGGAASKSPAGESTTPGGNVQPSDVPLPTPDPRATSQFEVM